MSDDDRLDQFGGHGQIRIPPETWDRFAELCRHGRVETQEVQELEDQYARVDDRDSSTGQDLPQSDTRR